jgi:hypothetical protein
MSKSRNDHSIFFIRLGYAAHTTFPLCLTFHDAPCVVGDFCFLQIYRTYGAFDAAKRKFMIPKRK